MIKLFSVKVGKRLHTIFQIFQTRISLFVLTQSCMRLVQEKQKKDAEAAASGKIGKQTAGEIRLQKGVTLECIQCAGIDVGIWMGD